MKITNDLNCYLSFQAFYLPSLKGLQLDGLTLPEVNHPRQNRMEIQINNNLVEPGGEYHGSFYGV
jgi:hypothetical protein